MKFGDPGELAWYVESNQCITCTHKNFRPDAGIDIGGYYMCAPMEMDLIMEGDVPDEFTEDAVCTLYRDETLDEESAPEQLTLDTLFE